MHNTVHIGPSLLTCPFKTNYPLTSALNLTLRVFFGFLTLNSLIMAKDVIHGLENMKLTVEKVEVIEILDEG